MMREDAGFESNERITGREPVQRKDKPAEQWIRQGVKVDQKKPDSQGVGCFFLHEEY